MSFSSSDPETNQLLSASPLTNHYVDTADLLSAPTEFPTAPSTIWLELPGRYLRISPINLFANDVLNADGIIYATIPVNQ